MSVQAKFVAVLIAVAVVPPHRFRVAVLGSHSRRDDRVPRGPHRWSRPSPLALYEARRALLIGHEKLTAVATLRLRSLLELGDPGAEVAIAYSSRPAAGECPEKLDLPRSAGSAPEVLCRGSAFRARVLVPLGRSGRENLRLPFRNRNHLGLPRPVRVVQAAYGHSQRWRAMPGVFFLYLFGQLCANYRRYLLRKAARGRWAFVSVVTEGVDATLAVDQPVALAVDRGPLVGVVRNSPARARRVPPRWGRAC